jgi:hypothetical protein
MDATRLEWGLRDPDMKGDHLWGMRAILDTRKTPVLDIVPNRCGFVTPAGPGTGIPDDFVLALNGTREVLGILPMLGQMVRTGGIRPGDVGHFQTDTNLATITTWFKAAGGYLYVTCAWRAHA